MPILYFKLTTNNVLSQTLMKLKLNIEKQTLSIKKNNLPELKTENFLPDKLVMLCVFQHFKYSCLFYIYTCVLSHIRYICLEICFVAKFLRSIFFFSSCALVFMKY